MTIPTQPPGPGSPATPATPATPFTPVAPVSTTPSTTSTNGGGASTSDTAKDQAQQTAGTAADEGKHVAGVAMGEAKQVAGEAKQQAQHLLEEARTQVDGQARTQRDRLVGTLQEFSGQLDSMADGQGAPSGLAQDAVRQVADRARDLTSRLDGREPSDLLDDVRAFARRKPGTFLLGAVAAGLVAGRLTRGAKAANTPEPTDQTHGGVDPVLDPTIAPVVTTPTVTGTPTVGGTPTVTGTGTGIGAPYSGATSTQTPL